LEGNKDKQNKKIILKSLQGAEEYTRSATLGMNGGIDVRFKAYVYPNFNSQPELKFEKNVIIELKTGKKKKEHMDQTMCYLMTHYGINAVDNYGFVIYSDKANLKSFVVKPVEPDLKYFCDIVLHRNFYILNPKFYFEYIG
jgi:hypothetical protein